MKMIQGILSLVCLVSFLPIIAVFPPLYSWSKEYWPKRGLLFLLAGLSMGIFGFLMFISLNIYLRFIMFTIAALIFQYHMTIGIVSIIAGCLGFVSSILSQVSNSYLHDKTFIEAVAQEVHAAKLLEFEEPHNKLIKYNLENPRNRIHVPELVWWCPSTNWPCIPRQLYEGLVEEFRPLGTQRAKILIKVVIMAIFVGFIYTVMGNLGMLSGNSAFDAVQSLITVVVVVFPALLAKLGSSHKKAIILIRKKAIILREIDKFLVQNEMFYNYKDVLPVEDDEEEHNEGEKAERRKS